MSTFKLVAGIHTDENGKRYVKNEKVESDLDLVKLFPNKFTLLEGESAAPAPPAKTFVENLAPEPGHKRSTMPGSRHQ